MNQSRQPDHLADFKSLDDLKSESAETKKRFFLSLYNDKREQAAKDLIHSPSDLLTADGYFPNDVNFMINGKRQLLKVFFRDWFTQLILKDHKKLPAIIRQVFQCDCLMLFSNLYYPIYVNAVYQYLKGKIDLPALDIQQRIMLCRVMMNLIRERNEFKPNDPAFAKVENLYSQLTSGDKINCIPDVDSFKQSMKSLKRVKVKRRIDVSTLFRTNFYPHFLNLSYSTGA